MSRLHERMMSFFATNGHNHDGINSTPVHIPDGSIGASHLSEALSELLSGSTGTSATDTAATTGDLSPVPDAVLTTPTISAGGTYTGTIQWVNMCVVRFMRILMSVDTECTITFYHTASYLDEDREFRAVNCGNKFMWEGPWVHYDESASGSLHYRVTNTGNAAASFNIRLKSGTMVANEVTGTVTEINAAGASLQGSVNILAGTGIDITTEGQSIKVTALTELQTVARSKWSLTPVRPTAITSSAALVNPGYLTNDGYTHDTARYCEYGSGLQWITIDMGVSKTLGAIQILFYFADGRSYKDVKVETSLDNAAFTTVKNTGDVWATGEGLWINDVHGVTCRYIRVWANGNTVNAGNHMVKCIPYMIGDKA